MVHKPTRVIDQEILDHLEPIEKVIAKRYIREGRYVLRNETSDLSPVKDISSISTSFEKLANQNLLSPPSSKIVTHSTRQDRSLSHRRNPSSLHMDENRGREVQGVNL